MPRLDPLEPQSLIFRGTAAHKGRRIAVSPENSSMQRLSYARILLDAGTPKTRFETNGHEACLICLSGSCTVRIDARESHDLGQCDAIYLPRKRLVEVTTSAAVDLVESSAEVDNEYPVQVVRYAEVAANPALKFTTGVAGATRELNILIGNNVKAGRIMAGFTRSAPGNWTSWPPHEKGELLEELYVYFDMKPPAFGVQFVYTKPDDPEFVGVVREGDAVVMPRGYHPNVSIPGHSINFVWLLAAHREVNDRVFGVANVQPEFKHTASGLEAARR